MRRPALALLLLLLPVASVRADDATVKPVPVKIVSPEFPAALHDSHTKGVVTVQFTVDVSGAVTEVAVVKSTNAGFDAAALDAVSKWRFKPGEKAGKPTAMRVKLPILFDPEA